MLSLYIKSIINIPHLVLCASLSVVNHHMISIAYKQMFHIYVPIADVSYDIYILFGVDVTQPQPREENLAISTSSFNFKLHSYYFLEDFLFFNVPQVKQSTHMWRLWKTR